MLYYETKHPEVNNYISNEFFTNFNFPLHLHNHIEIAYVSKGALNIRIEDNEFTINQGGICIVLPMEAHSYSTNSTSECQIIVLARNFAEEFVNEYKNLAAVNPVFYIPHAQIYMDAITDDLNNFYMVKGIVNFLASEYISDRKFIEKNKKISSFIRKTVEYIDNNYDKEPSVEVLAESLGYTTNYLSSLFNKTFNKTFMTMVNEKRISKAIELLKNTNLNITEISLQCGYNSIRSFNRNFLSFVGVSPTSFNPSNKNG